MLYMIGTLALDTRPFNADAMARTTTADVVSKNVIGGLNPSEFTGEGRDEIRLSGQLLPTKIGGLTELEVAQEMRRKGTRVPVMRGDGFRLGWYAITRITERHSHLMRDGVGFTVSYAITLKKVQDDRRDGSQVIAGLVGLFEALA